MKNTYERVSDASFGELGNEFAEKARNRIHWVCENAAGENILDVGCSQGITSILLGREGKKVLGVDLLEEVINYANEMLLKEEKPTRECVKFLAANFMNMDFTNKRFDTIIFGEIIEHLTDPKRFLNKAVTLLEDEGSIIITLPFGINNYFDHKKTYYLMDLLGLQGDKLVIQEIKFLGKWIGAILKKKNKNNIKLNVNAELIKRLEVHFTIIEKDLPHVVNNNKPSLDVDNLQVEVEIEMLQDKILTKNTEINDLKDQLTEKENLSKTNRDQKLEDLKDILRKDNEIKDTFRN